MDLLQPQVFSSPGWVGLDGHLMAPLFPAVDEGKTPLRMTKRLNLGSKPSTGLHGKSFDSVLLGS
jgi:hypothetical protein